MIKDGDKRNHLNDVFEQGEGEEKDALVED